MLHLLETFHGGLRIDGTTLRSGATLDYIFPAKYSLLGEWRFSLPDTANTYAEIILP